MVDDLEEFDTLKEREDVVIGNPEAAHLLLKLFPHFLPSIQAVLVESFLSILKSSTANTYFLSPQLSSVLLDRIEEVEDIEILSRPDMVFRNILICILERLVGIFCILGAHSISVRDLKRLFWLMRSPEKKMVINNLYCRFFLTLLLESSHIFTS